MSRAMFARNGVLSTRFEPEAEPMMIEVDVTSNAPNPADRVEIDITKEFIQWVKECFDHLDLREVDLNPSDQELLTLNQQLDNLHSIYKRRYRNLFNERKPKNKSQH